MENMHPEDLQEQGTPGACACHHPKAPVLTEPTHTTVGGQAQMVALLDWRQMRPLARSQKFLQLCSAPGAFPVDWADLICRTRKPAAICAQHHQWAKARPRVQRYSIKGGLLLHLRGQQQLMMLLSDDPEVFREYDTVRNTAGCMSRAHSSWHASCPFCSPARKSTAIPATAVFLQVADGCDQISRAHHEFYPARSLDSSH